MTDATISWLSGPVLRARTEGRFHISEAVSVGAGELLGEVIRVDTDSIVAQVYEDTTGLRPGDTVRGSGERLSIRLRPGLLGKIFDGLLRPLATMPGDTVLPGVRREDPARLEYRPVAAVGDHVHAGQVIGIVSTGRVSEKHVVPPRTEGVVKSIVGQGEYRDDETLCRLRNADGSEVDLSVGHDWPIREPRPVRRRLSPGEPLVTGQRIIDTLVPVARGSRATLPGGFGTGKTILQESLAKWCDADVIVSIRVFIRGWSPPGFFR